MNVCKNKALSLLLCMVLIVAMALCMTGCNDTTPDTSDAEHVQTVEQSFLFEVVYADGTMETFEVTTDKATVGEALLEEGLIAGDGGPYGLYVTAVNGVVADYNVDGTYWAFYVDGGYASTGVDTTEVVDGSTYSFKVEK